MELDSAGRAVIWGTGSYKFVVTDSLDNIIETTDNVTVFNVSTGSIIPSATGSGTVSAITADFTPNLTLTDKQLCIVTSVGANITTTPTFSPDGVTARTIVKYGGQALALGNTGAVGFPMLLQYDLTNTRWELMNPATNVPIASLAEIVAGTAGKFVDAAGFKSVVTSWASYTPTFTSLGTVSNVSVWWRRVGDTLELRGKWTNGTTAGTEARMTLPSGLTSDATKVPSIQLCGQYAFDQTGAAYLVTLIESNSAYMCFGRQLAGETGLTKTTGSLLVTGATISITAQIPITGW